MAIEFEGKSIETTESGFLVNMEDWSKPLAQKLALEQEIELSDKHWDVINYLRDEFINHGGNQPNNRTIVKALADKWGKNVTSKEMYDLFPGNPSKQAGLIAGLPESKRKGGY